MSITRAITAVAALAALSIVAACVPPPPVTYEVPDPRPGQTVPLNWAHTPAPAHRNVRYGPAAHQVADVYLPTQGGNRGVIIAVHGGGFTGGTKEDVPKSFGTVMAQTRRGFAVVPVRYALTNGNTNAFPKAVHDVSAAVRWVRNSGADFGMNPRTVVVAGNSAGGTLAALVGVGWNANPKGALGVTERVDGWVSYAGVMDFVNTRAGVTQLGRVWLGPNRDSTAWLAAASPVNHIDPLDPPGYVAHGDLDTIVPFDQLNLIVAAAAKAGITQRLYTDRVDTGGTDTSSGIEIPCRWHLPMCGVNHAVFNTWLDAVVARSL